jgi:hypothetical protein
VFRWVVATGQPQRRGFTSQPQSQRSMPVLGSCLLARMPRMRAVRQRRCLDPTSPPAAGPADVLDQPRERRTLASQLASGLVPSAPWALESGAWRHQPCRLARPLSPGRSLRIARVNEVHLVNPHGEHGQFNLLLGFLRCFGSRRLRAPIRQMTDARTGPPGRCGELLALVPVPA